MAPAAMEAVEAHDKAEQDVTEVRVTKQQVKQSWARVLCLTASVWRSVCSLLAGWLCESSKASNSRQADDHVPHLTTLRPSSCTFARPPSPLPIPFPTQSTQQPAGEVFAVRHPSLLPSVCSNPEPRVPLQSKILWSEQAICGIQARQRALGNVQFLGDFFHRRMLKEKVIRDCIKELLGDVAAPKQGHLECMVKLMNIVGQQLDANPRAIIYMNAYFEHITMLGKNMSLDGRIRLMLQASLCKWCVRQLILNHVQADADCQRQAVLC